jgi:23S rRNA (cytosine1962-C5)-methyltransferase
MFGSMRGTVHLPPDIDLAAPILPQVMTAAELGFTHREPSDRLDLLTVEPWADHALLDFGHGRKLERYGPLVVDRPEEQAMAAPSLPEAEWARADAVFDGDAEEGEGRWRFGARPVETFPMAWDGLPFLGRVTPFRHLGVFPEQAAHWGWMAERIAAAGRPLRVLNLFGYTGLASLVAARAGAEVTHVDASKRAVAFARENAGEAGLDDRPIRWIVEDAVKFAQRELRRGKRYDGIVLDPPKFGRGPGGEVWRLFEHLPAHFADCVSLLSDEAEFLILSAYAIRASALATDDLARSLLAARGGEIRSGELALATAEGRLLSTSLFTRWSRG